MKNFKELLSEKFSSIDGTSSNSVISLPIQLTMYDKRVSRPSRLVAISKDPVKNLDVYPPEYILICMLWKMMDYDTEYVINYKELLKILCVGNGSCKDEPIARNIKGIIYRLGKQNIFKINELTTREAVVVKLDGGFGDCVQETHFHINDIKMLCCNDLTYTTKRKLINLLVKIKFSMATMVEGDIKRMLFIGYKKSFSHSLHIDVKTLSNQLEKLEHYHSIFVYTQFRYMVRNKYRHSELMIRDAGSEIAHRANSDLGYSLWGAPLE